MIYSKTPEDHLKHLGLVLQAFRDQNFYCRVQKCKFALKSVPFLGHIVSEEGISLHPKKAKVVQDWATPANVAEMRSFLGLAQYFSRFIAGYATLTVTLTNLLRKNVPWNWNGACQHAFDTVKHALIHAPALVLPNPDLPYEVVTDACQTGVGAVLLQQGKPVAFAGRKLNDAETRYTMTDQEFLGVVFALKQWRCYLQGARHSFTIVTDPNPNVYFSTQPNLSSRQARWSELLQDYDFNWQYRPGSKNVADPVSRQMILSNCILTLKEFGPFEWKEKGTLYGISFSLCNHAAFVSAVVHNAVWTAQMPEPCAYTAAVTTRKQASHQAAYESAQKDVDATVEADITQQHMLENILKGYKKDSLFARMYSHMYEEGGLWRHANGGIVVPEFKDSRRTIMSELHESVYAGRPGERRTISLIRRYFWWPTMDPDIRDFVKGCAVCQRDKASNRKVPGVLVQPEVPEGKWQVVSMDFITALPLTARLNNMILTVVDTFSKMVHLFPCRKTADARATATFLWDNIFCKHGPPKQLISDRDVRFNNEVFQSIMHHLSTNHAMSTAHHPQTDGQTERMNRIVEETLRHYVNDRQDDWDLLLPAVEFSINNTFQESIQTTPFYLNFGYHPTLPVDIRMSASALADSFMQKAENPACRWPVFCCSHGKVQC